MECEGHQVTRKRLKPALCLDDKGGNEGTSDKAEFETNEIAVAVAASEAMEFNISCILEKIENFTHLASELLESGKASFKQLSKEFEERMITIHKEQVEKWQEEIKQLRLLDASNEEAHALLHNARFLLQNAHFDS